MIGNTNDSPMAVVKDKLPGLIFNQSMTNCAMAEKRSLAYRDPKEKL
ncbi:hypothetical protein LNP20_04890 [Klebsiella pneumoniae subsp. pneumoniae]|nr:hypothetical protein [Klebsiella pneumoniae subsp. pneumoniae]